MLFCRARWWGLLSICLYNQPFSVQSDLIRASSFFVDSNTVAAANCEGLWLSVSTPIFVVRYISDR